MTEQNNSCPVLTILIGLPRSGKSTFARENKGNAVILCADELRYLVYNQRFWVEGEDLMWSIHSIIFKLLIKQAVDLIIDETNYTRASRALMIQLAKGCGYKVRGVVFSTPADICIKRALAEEYPRIIPFIERLSQQYEAPTEDEGFDEIVWL